MHHQSEGTLIIAERPGFMIASNQSLFKLLMITVALSEDVWKMDCGDPKQQDIGPNQDNNNLKVHMTQSLFFLQKSAVKRQFE